jgi:hypothetical protein
MSWKDMMRRVLPPIDGAVPDVTSHYGEVEGRPEGSSKPHRGVDFNYWGVARLNRSNPAMRAPVTGIVTRADKGRYGTIAIRDSNGFSHEILHSRAQHVTVGDPVVAGQLIGTMGNTGLKIKDPHDRNHVHYQLRDRAGQVIDPSAFWDQQGPIDPNPPPPTFLGEHQQYLRGSEANLPVSSNRPATPGAMSLPKPAPMDASAPLGTGGQFLSGSATSSRPLYETRSFVAPPEESAPADARKDIRRLVRMPIRKEDLAGFDPNAPAAAPNEIPSADRPTSFDDRFGNWTSFADATAPLAPDQPVAPPPLSGRPSGILTGKPMPAYPFVPPIFGFPGSSSRLGGEDWASRLIRSTAWDKKVR